jgi:acyl-CoA synthetase (AMP-forming)/AMP-acid ligase II
LFEGVSARQFSRSRSRRRHAERGPAPAPGHHLRIVEIALTSGTTGLPKLASLSAKLKQATFEGFTSRLQVTEADRVLVMSPLTQGIGGMCLFCLRLGASLIMVHEARPGPEALLRLAAQHRATVLVGVPTNVIRMLNCDELAKTDLSQARLTAVAGAPMPPDVAERWETTTGSKVCSFYGSMDAGQLAVASPGDPPAKRWTTVGRPHDSCETRIADDGEIWMRGETVQTRYWDDPQGRGPQDDQGWVHMGDLGHLDEEGFLHVTGRKKDLIIRGGSNVNPIEVEAAIRTHPKVKEVAVVGEPHPELGETSVAFVVGDATLTLQEIKDHLDQRGLAKYKWPERLVRLDEIPTSGPGKIDRRALNDRLLT